MIVGFYCNQFHLLSKNAKHLLYITSQIQEFFVFPCATYIEMETEGTYTIFFLKKY